MLVRHTPHARVTIAEAHCASYKIHVANAVDKWLCQLAKFWAIIEIKILRQGKLLH